MTVPGIDKSEDGTHAFAMTARYHMPICTTCGIPEIAYRLGDMAFKKLSCEEFRKQIGAEDARCPKCGSDCVDVDFYESGDITSFVCRNCHAKFRREISLYDPNGDHDYSYVLKDEPEVKMERVKCPKCDHVFANEGHEMCDVEVNFSDETFMIIAKMAHEKDITLNQLITDILRKQMDKEDKEKGSYTKNLHDQYTEEVDLQSGFTYVDWLEQRLEVDLQSGFTYVNWLEQKLYDGKQK